MTQKKDIEVAVSVIVPVFNQWHLLKALIDAFAQQSENFDCELLIVDNGSDNILEVQESVDISVFECKKPGSYSARNMALSHTKGDLILFTDADCIPDENWISTILDAYEQSDRKTLLAGNVIIRSNNANPTVAELYDIAAGLPQERYVSKGYAVTANLAIPRAVFDEIGSFDEQRFSGGDADICQRAIKAGFSLNYIPEAVVYHPARKTWDQYATKVRRMKGGQIRAGSISKRLKYGLITLLPPVWRFWRTCFSDKLTTIQKIKVVFFQFRLWFVEVFEMFALLLGKQPERR